MCEPGTILVPKSSGSHGMLLTCLSFPPGAEAMMENPVFSVLYVIPNDNGRNYFTSGYFNFSSIINKN